MSNVNEFFLLAAYKLLHQHRQILMSDDKAKLLAQRIKISAPECIIPEHEAKSFAWFNTVSIDPISQKLAVYSDKKSMIVDLKNNHREIRQTNYHAKFAAFYKNFLVIGTRERELLLYDGDKQIRNKPLHFKIDESGCGDDHVVGMTVFRGKIIYLRSDQCLMQLDIKMWADETLATPAVCIEIDNCVQALYKDPTNQRLYYIKRIDKTAEVLSIGRPICKLLIDQEEKRILAFNSLSISRSYIATMFSSSVIALYNRRGVKKDELSVTELIKATDKQSLMRHSLVTIRGITFLALCFRKNLGGLVLVNDGKLIPISIGFDIQMKNKVGGNNSVFGMAVKRSKYKSREFSLLFNGYSILTSVRISMA